jgi:hypothetical protein
MVDMMFLEVVVHKFQLAIESMYIFQRHPLIRESTAIMALLSRVAISIEVNYYSSHHIINLSLP